MCLIASFQLYLELTPIVTTPQQPDSHSSYDLDDVIFTHQNNMEMIASGIHLDYTMNIPGPYCVPVGTEVLLMKVDETYENNYPFTT
jgi:hypothetical protein